MRRLKTALSSLLAVEKNLSEKKAVFSSSFRLAEGFLQERFHLAFFFHWI